MNFGIEVMLQFLLPFFAALAVIEFFTARHLYHLKESVSSFVIATVAVFIAAFTKMWALGVFILVFEFFKELRMELVGYESFGWAWYVWIIAIIADDFSFYWHHRLSHTIRILWAAHVPHHNAETFNLTVSLRNGWFITLYKPVFWLWLPLLGFEPIMVASCLIINGAYQLFLHTQLVPSLGWFEKVFNTPYIHRVHHSCNIEYLDRNHGGMLIIWDKLFGTYQDVIPDMKPKYGVLKGPDSLNPITANTHEFVSIWKDVLSTSNWGEKLKYIFYPPGWSPNSDSMTSKDLQEELKRAPLEPTPVLEPSQPLV